MTNVAFHFNVMDKIAYACRLLRKASYQGAKITVTGEEYLLTVLDDALWTFDAGEFLPHCNPSASAHILDNTGIILTSDARQSKHVDVLVNLGSVMPEGFERYLRLIELVGKDESERKPARERWRYYNSRGYSIQSFEVSV
ncbi:MAG: DNA polymerase III subunit chi [Saezia sp.]